LDTLASISWWVGASGNRLQRGAGLGPNAALAGDGVQLTLRFSFPPRLKRSVRRRIFGTLETGMLDNYDEPNQTTSTNGKPMDSKESEKKPQRIAELFFESSEVLLTVRSYFDQFQTLPYNSLIFGTRVQPDGNSTAHRWVHGAEQAKSPQIINFQKLCDFKPLPNVEKRRKNERTVRY
jgi:hypothetical protein